MNFVLEEDLDAAFPPFAFLRENLGVIPRVFRAQALLARAIEAEAQLLGAILIQDGALSRVQKEFLSLAVATAEENGYCAALHGQMLRSLGVPERQLDLVGLPEADAALLDFAVKLSRHAPWIGGEDIEALRRQRFTDEQILEAIQTVALAKMLCLLSTGLGVEPDFEPRQLRRPETSRRLPPARPRREALPEDRGPYLRTVDLSPLSFRPFALLEAKLGSVPNLFRAQTLKPDVIDAEVNAVDVLLLTGRPLPRIQKEYIVLVASAANLNTYCVAAHCGFLRALGVPEEDSDQIAINHHRANLSEETKALLDFSLKLAKRPAEYGPADPDGLRGHGFTEPQILEAIVMTSFNSFLNTLSMGLGVEPSTKPRLAFSPGEEHLFLSREHPIEGAVAPARFSGEQPDADAALVARVQGGDLDAFEELVRRHGRRLQRTLAGILGRSDEAEDAVQDAFLKAFQHIGEFQGRSRFSTWLTQIAINVGLQCLRSRRRLEPFQDIAGAEDEFRPQVVQAWRDDPEEMYSKVELRELIEQGLMKLPDKYRVVVLLRDLHQLSTEETAAVLGLAIPGVKARLMRGRLMLREVLAPYFVPRQTRGHRA